MMVKKIRKRAKRSLNILCQGKGSNFAEMGKRRREEGKSAKYIQQFKIQQFKIKVCPTTIFLKNLE